MLTAYKKHFVFEIVHYTNTAAQGNIKAALLLIVLSLSTEKCIHVGTK